MSHPKTEQRSRRAFVGFEEVSKPSPADARQPIATLIKFRMTHDLKQAQLRRKLLDFPN